MSRQRAQRDSYEWRLYVILGVVVVLFVSLAGRILFLQVLEVEGGREFLKSQGAMRSVRTAEIPAYRGLITDRRGEPLAVSTPVISLWADPRVLSTVADLAPLASALDIGVDELGTRLAQYSGKRFMYLSRHHEPDSARRILDLRTPGVHWTREYRRFYPAGEVAAQLVGFTNVDGTGIAGLELAYDDWLRGVAGRKQYIKDLHGEAVRDIGVLQEAQPGRPLQLSIDLRLQYLLHTELQRAMQVTGSESGSIVTLDSRTGEVLGMVSDPAYNPNDREALTPGATRNRAMTDVLEPGSTMKPLTLVAALESGEFTTETLIDTSPGRIRVGRKVLPDPSNYGEITLSRVIEKSSQVGVTKVSLALGHEPVWEVFRRFGLGETTGTGFPGESAGQLPSRQRWSPIEQVTLAFGYGLTATPLQLARAYSAFANGGILPQVSLLRVDEGERPGQRVISSDTAWQVLDVLHRVTGEHGTARKARVEGYAVGGKTGTVHKVGPGGYLQDQYIALFAGVAPIDEPRFVTVVVLDRPKGDNYGGGAAAAPVFARVASGVLRLLDVAPTQLPAIPPVQDVASIGRVTP
ncbi:peptidoglycan D,D-transpeptidase FtsI family protein [Chromatocurvus halotolerans]|uniref:Peptidoglycan D,D-transpeptidase FtsI n=1 Tax=Chromatocurvus halotolerans TaxID=1132028 RepID=A0A4R2KTN4_9GAMM|nr:penicillin-binding transpeptidase domain-containing protein [Chromatocurvus halotolerans]TCO76202.1 peptidoglycan synthetase FtsI [Chromatocurvus halotolerans]